MDFQKYNSLENHYRTPFINKIEYEGKSGGIWIAHEKIHGSNLSFWYNGTDIKVAKRSGFLGEFEKFNNFQEVLENYKASIISTYQSMCSKNFITEGDTLIIYGEIFGGHLKGYESKPHTSHVQGGIQYCPDVDFLYFDIKVIRTNGDEFN
jgi:Rnl2 family RNA ligase